MYSRCPRCDHTPLPADQALPAACPACGVILEKIGKPLAKGTQGAWPARHGRHTENGDEAGGVRAMLLHVPVRVDSMEFWMRLVLLALFTLWGAILIALDFRSGEIAGAFLHRPLLVFHEAGHVIFAILGEWMAVAGGTLAQLLIPLILGGALLLARRDPFGAAMGLWFFGASLLDVAPYMYDALHPQLMLLSGAVGEEGGHDWIYLFSSMGWLARAQAIGGITHKLGACVIVISLVWAAAVLRLAHGHLAGIVLDGDRQP